MLSVVNLSLMSANKYLKFYRFCFENLIAWYKHIILILAQDTSNEILFFSASCYIYLSDALL
ncbi:hypothetical protein A1OE_265 [Candidatus Endolissoclinum faulkneri L2]|uniref:Uncharacterized protein n=1 Tax=Candidatus Endolissoclinum faulkneri L2 TaxID=1193729 RepID=K7YFW0_9PROT|nr:hypothetical protein A1OE_265 [Candidatus Endolissoclinum faulkneri L2]